MGTLAQEIRLDHTEAQAQLTAFYEAALLELRESACFDANQMRQLSAPFLLNVERSYFEAPVRVMYVGQETRGWESKLDTILVSPEAVPRLLARYQRGMQDSWSGPFLRTLKLLTRELGRGGPGSVVWTNLQKMDVDRGPNRSRNARGYSNALDEFSRKLFRFEVELLRPHVLIFGTGPHYDKLIQRCFPGRQESRVVVPRAQWHFTVDSIRCYRTWHPRTVPRKNWPHTLAEYYRAIIEDVHREFPAVYG